MRIALAQISSGTDPDENSALVAEQTSAAAALGAELVIFPEATMCRFGVKLGPIAQPLDGAWAQAVGQIAADNAVSVVAGMFTPGDGGRVRNTLVIAGPHGAISGYDKIHLYDAFGFEESRTVQAGDRAHSFRVGDVTVGAATCYDIRFPTLFTALADGGATLVVVPASWGSGPGKLEQWRTLAAARALDSGCFVAAVGQAVPGDPEVAGSAAPTGIGHSILAGPFGTVHTELGDHPGLAVLDLDFGEVERARASIAVLSNRRDVNSAAMTCADSDT
ncbi:carbon-nitrogen hydrolase family protein [Gordonia rubripertincta]|uniref:Carbon-nitrogen hydrolase family protein n=1 Tax=Gordonia rubripertincta TaxID=36822 RepID=A0ABT4N3I0_GORRU|nr:carbon-nitrogen hydrolase family protein [Gordonia rubripertincta]MCZ4553828.1 carbon-nitrogen hydrolase family protein [Gordonia rubripertincta]